MYAARAMTSHSGTVQPCDVTAQTSTGKLNHAAILFRSDFNFWAEYILGYLTKFLSSVLMKYDANKSGRFWSDGKQLTRCT